MRLFNLPLFFDEADGGGSGGAIDDISADLAILNDDTPPDDGKKGRRAAANPEGDEGEEEADLATLEGDDADDDADDSEGDEGDGSEEEGDEEEGSEEGEEPPTSLEASGRPSIKDIKKEFPDIFKKFPQLKAAYFRDAKFSEHFADPSEIPDVIQRSENYQKLEASVVSGDSSLLIGELNANNPKALKAFAANFLPTLQKENEDVYRQVSTPIIEDVLYFASKYAERVGDKNLTLAARHLANFVFANGGEVPDISKRGGKDKPNPAEEQLHTERQNWETQKFQEAGQEVNTRIESVIRANVMAAIDPDKEMSDFTKGAAADKAWVEVNKLLMQDKPFLKQMDLLWDKAKKSGYSVESKTRLKDAFLVRAKTLLPSIRQRLRQEALGKSAANPGGRKKQGQKDEQTPRKRFVASSGRQGDQGRARVVDPSKIDYKRTSDADILNDNITTRK